MSSGHETDAQEDDFDADFDTEVERSPVPSEAERAWAEWLRFHEVVLGHRAVFFAGWQAAMLRALEVTEGFRDSAEHDPDCRGVKGKGPVE